MTNIKSSFGLSLAGVASAIDPCSFQWPPPDGKCSLNCGATVLNHEAARNADEGDFTCQVAFATGKELDAGNYGEDFDGVDHIVTNHFNYSHYFFFDIFTFLELLFINILEFFVNKSISILSASRVVFKFL